MAASYGIHDHKVTADANLVGRILILGGIGCLLQTFLSYAGLTHAMVGQLVIPATVGEFWIIGYLLIYGIRESNEGI